MSNSYFYLLLHILGSHGKACVLALLSLCSRPCRATTQLPQLKVTIKVNANKITSVKSSFSESAKDVIFAPALVSQHKKRGERRGESAGFFSLVGF